MFPAQPLSSQKPNFKQPSKSSVRFNLSYCLSLTLATAGICWLNSGRAIAATKLTNPHQNSDRSFHDCQDHHALGLLPRIISLLAVPFWSDRSANLSPNSKHIPQTKNASNFQGIGGSSYRNFTPLYLSQAQSSSTKEFGNARLGSIKPSAISYSHISAVKPQPKLQTQTYTVKSGDTINRIAQKHRVSRNEIIKLNNLKNSNIIFVSQQLKIPVTKLEDSTSKISVTKTNLASINNSDVKLNSKIQPLNEDNLLSKASQNSDSRIAETIPLQLPPLPSEEEYLPNAFDGYAWPAQGVLTSGYGWRWGRLHKGIDIAGPIGTPVFAAASGEVISAEWNSGGYGNLIKLKHLDGSVTIYAHNNKILVNSGQKVNQGDQIAEMGNTGFSTGSHLHFEIHSKERGIVNPLALLQ